jgi:hypothetical protein
MKVFVWSIILISIAFLVHLLIWRIRLPVRQTNTLLIIFLSILLSGFGISYSGFHDPNLVLYLLTDVSEYLLVALFFIAVTFGYIITYSALEAESPSLLMVLAIYQTGEEGLKKYKLEQLMTDEVLIDPRIADLLRDRMVYRVGERYQLTSKGKKFAWLFGRYRDLMKAEKGG